MKLPRPRYFPSEDGHEDVAVPAHHAGGQREPWRRVEAHGSRPSPEVRQRLAESRRAAVESSGARGIAWCGLRLLA